MLEQYLTCREPLELVGGWEGVMAAGKFSHSNTPLSKFGRLPL